MAVAMSKNRPVHGKPWPHYTTEQLTETLTEYRRLAKRRKQSKDDRDFWQWQVCKAEHELAAIAKATQVTP